MQNAHNKAQGNSSVAFSDKENAFELPNARREK
jgi:hypothetical protein